MIPIIKNVNFISVQSWTFVRGSTIGLAGCGIWLILGVIFGIKAENRSGKREF